MTPAQNSAPNDPQNDLAATLQRQADRFAARGGAGLDFEQVVSRAGEIRRGRRMRATMAMAAVVVAVAVPVGITVVGNDPVVKDKTQVAAKPDPSAIGLGDHERGAAPRAGYAYGDKLYGAGDPIPFGSGRETSSVARIDGGFLVAQYDPSGNGDQEASFVGDDGRTKGEVWSLASSFATSPDRKVGAFVDTDGRVLTVQDGGDNAYAVGQLPAGVGYQVEAVVGEDCSAGADASDCTVYAQVNQEKDPSQQVYAISPGKDAVPVFDGLLNVAGISTDGLVAGQVSYSGQGSCWAVRDQDGTQLWKTCENSLFSFSPDGKYLLAGPAYMDGPGGGGLTILDARTGDNVADLETVPGAFVADPRWEDDTHVMVPVYDAATWAVLRVRIDGNREYATEKAPDDDTYVSPFKLG